MYKVKVSAADPITLSSWMEIVGEMNIFKASSYLGLNLITRIDNMHLSSNQWFASAHLTTLHMLEPRPKNSRPLEDKVLSVRVLLSRIVITVFFLSVCHLKILYLGYFEICYFFIACRSKFLCVWSLALVPSRKWLTDLFIFIFFIAISSQ